MQTVIIVVGWIAAVLTVTLGLPQLIKTAKVKKVEGVNFYSVFSFGLGLGAWVMFSGTLGSRGLQPGIANGISLIIFATLVSLLFKFSNNSFWWVASVIAFSYSLISWFVFILGEVNGWSLNRVGSIIISLIAGVGTTFAFFPQVIKTFKEKEIANLSLGLFILGVVVNGLWTFYWGSSNQEELSTWLIPTILSFIGTTIYLTQVVLIVKLKKEIKK